MVLAKYAMHVAAGEEDIANASITRDNRLLTFMNTHRGHSEATARSTVTGGPGDPVGTA